MKKIITLLLLLIALMGNTIAHTPGENFDVTHYEIRLWDFDFANQTIQGETFIDLTVTAPTNTFVLELKSLTVTDAATDSYSVTNFTQDGDLLTIVVDETVSTGETLTLDVRYGGNTFSETWGGVEWWGADYVYTLGVGFDSQPHNLGKTWFPCVDNFADKATYSLYITVTNDKKAICGGNNVITLDNGDGTSTWQWEIPQEVATYHPSFAIGDYVLWEDTYHGIDRDIPIEVYVKPSQIGNVPGTFSHIHEIAAFYEENFAPYPFNRIGYVCTGKGCMEHIDNIAITPGIITGNTSQEEYVAHELSHMYFGNLVTCHTAEDMWLNEGMAQFCGMYYLAGVYGESDFQNAISSTTNAITSWCKQEENWIPLNNIPLDKTYDNNAVYDRGAVIANTMMNYMGRENFITGLRHYLNTHAYGTVSSEQFRDALTEATGIDMTGFFDTYVFTAGMPHYNVNLVNVTPNGTQYIARIQMSYWHYGPSHLGQNNRVEVTFVSDTGQKHTELVGWDGLEAELDINLDFEPVAAFVDFYNRFLDAKLDNNLTATSSTVLNQGKFKVLVTSVSDSTVLRIEDHFVGPDNDPELPYLTLSTSHFWNFYRNDFGDADISAQITFSNSLGQDGDIIFTENDSAVLLYRANIHDTWHTIPYTQEGNWKLGRFTVNNVQSGQYTIGVIDKILWGVNENTTPALRVYPNPTNGVIRGQNGEYRITNLSGQTLLSGTTQDQIDVSNLNAGVYLITINGKTQKFIIQ